MTTDRLTHKFVEFVPERLEPGQLYISMEHSVATHLCACGCRREVVTPLSPTDWSLTFDGVSISLHPSIGNWSFPCRSHYYVRKGRILWAGEMSQREIEHGRRLDRAAKAEYYGKDQEALPADVRATAAEKQPFVERASPKQRSDTHAGKGLFASIRAFFDWR